MGTVECHEEFVAHARGYHYFVPVQYYTVDDTEVTPVFVEFTDTGKDAVWVFVVARSDVREESAKVVIAGGGVANPVPCNCF